MMTDRHNADACQENRLTHCLNAHGPGLKSLRFFLPYHDAFGTPPKWVVLVPAEKNIHQRFISTLAQLFGEDLRGGYSWTCPSACQRGAPEIRPPNAQNGASERVSGSEDPRFESLLVRSGVPKKWHQMAPKAN